MISKWCLSPKVLSLTSCAGVTFKHPVPNSKSTYSSSIIGIVFPEIGTIAFLPFKLKCLSSFGLIQMAVSPKIVYGRVVATTK